MATLFSCVLVILAGLIGVPIAVLCLEVVAGTLRRPEGLAPLPDRRRRIAVVVPAHNESTAIVPTLEDIKAQLLPGDRLLVVADNCTDDTATIASATGADVVERNNPELIGKGFALDWGLRHLDSAPPDIVVIVDADCRLAERTIDRLAAACSMTDRPVQALDLMTAAEGSQLNYQIAEFAWRVKNWVRPLGLTTLGLPTQLMGTGMAFPWSVIRSAELCSGSLVEDLNLGLELTALGHPPLFCPSALVTSHFAASIQGAKAQRQRWEQGHLGVIFQRAPRLICAALARGNFGLLALALDLSVPPLSLLVLLVTATLGLTAMAALFGLSSVAFVVSIGDALAFFFAVGLAWLQFGRGVLPLGAILSIPRYVVGKLGIYRHVFFGKVTARWIRTDRTGS